MSFFEVFELIVGSFFFAYLMVLFSIRTDLFRDPETAELATLKAKALA
ncbi:hypothetical protein AGMMS50218_05970 [Actinomycetota bacterium]|nr:hypothetical protein AGMMS50218_05970 [Actinomycetota bacterium]